MPHLSRQVAAALLLLGSSAWAAAPRVFTLWPNVPPPAPVTPDLVELGGRVYRGACAGCHGEKGDGQGREGKQVQIPPRDFTTAQFIVRSTPAGTLPLDADLFRSIRHGFRPGAGMPAFTFLSDREVWAVIAHLKTFSARWKTEKVGAPVELPPPPPKSDALVAQGQGVFMGPGACFVCHGMQGQGDGPAAAGTVYTAGSHAGKPVRPANFTRPQDLKGGARAEDLYRSITTGLEGTPMPGFAASLTPEQRWQVVYFLQSLAK